MKKLFSLVSLLFASYLFADIERPRYNDEGVHLALPSWVTYSGGTKVDYPEESLTIGKNVVIDLPSTHYVELMGKTYTSLKVHNYGKIEFLQNESKYNENPYLRPYTFETGGESKSFVWKAYDRNAETDVNNIHQAADRYFTIVEQDFVRDGVSYSSQAVIYPNGEVQFQLWNRTTSMQTWVSWFNPILFDGNSSNYLVNREFNKNIDLLSVDGIRPGWVAKPLTSDESISIEYGTDKKSLHVTVAGEGGSDLGGIIAYDNSREHPVVGSFTSVDVKVSNVPTDYFSPYYCWYFSEYYGTHDAKYPVDNQIAANTNSIINLHRSEFEHTWNAYHIGKTIWIGGTQRIHNPIPEDRLDFIQAPAFKFQRVAYSGSLREYSFDINSIIYHLAQLPSVQFLPHKSSAVFKAAIDVGGRIDVSGLKGESDGTGNYMVYNVISSKKINGRISAVPGKVIDEITIYWVKPEENASGEKSQSILHGKSAVKGQNSVSSLLGFFFSKISDEEVEFNGSITGNYLMKVSYSNCEKRVLTIVPGMIKTESFASPNDVRNDIKNETATILNSFGGVVQTQKKVSDKEFLISTSYMDDLNNVSRIPMNFVHKNEKTILSMLIWHAGIVLQKPIVSFKDKTMLISLTLRGLRIPR